MKISKLIYKLLSFLIIVAMVACVYITFIERNLLIARSEEIELSKDPGQSIKIVQFTDTHLGKFYSLSQMEQAVQKINTQDPDIVVFTGDLFDIASQSNEKESLCSILQDIKAPLGKYAVFGNRDYGGGASRFYRSLMEEAGFIVLSDESSIVEFGDKSIAIYGADDYLLGSPNAEKLMKTMDENHINLLIVHEPDAVKNYEAYPIDIALSGHSHGGQVNIPFYGAIVKTNLCDVYFKGRYNLDNERKTTLFVSSGLGNTKLPFRLGNIPEIITFHVNF